MAELDVKRLTKIENTLYKYAEEYGLKFCPIEWDVIPDQKMFEIMAYHIPGQVSNWKFGRDYERIRTINENMYDGLPFEVVINSDPTGIPDEVKHHWYSGACYGTRYWSCCIFPDEQILPEHP